jgi:hypothetical protein
VIGPAASAGPLLVTVTVATPLVPGVNVGVLTIEVRSAAAGLVCNETGAVLFVVAGSAVPVVTPTVPPPIVELGAIDEGTLIGISTDTDEPVGIGPATTQVTGPLGIGPVQPAGSDTIFTPFGGV